MRRRALALVAAALLIAGVVWAGIAPLGLGGRGADEPSASEIALPVGPAWAGGVIVAEPVADLGHVPLDVPVQHVFRVVNAGTEPVRLGRPSVVVLDGC